VDLGAGRRAGCHSLSGWFLACGQSRKERRILLDKVLATFDSLQPPVAPEKLEGPTTSLMFLGVELGTIQMVRQLLSDKLTDVKQTVVSWLQRKDPKYCI